MSTKANANVDDIRKFSKALKILSVKINEAEKRTKDGLKQLGEEHKDIKNKEFVSTFEESAKHFPMMKKQLEIYSLHLETLAKKLDDYLNTPMRKY